MTKKLVEKIKEKEKESKKKKDKKSLPRNKTVSNFRSPLRDREHTKTSTNNTRTLKANKSMGHFLRSHKKDEKSLTLNPESKKKIDLKCISRTPKRTEKINSFYTKTDARSGIKKNEMYNTFNKKSEKKLETNLTLNKKDDKDKDKNKKIIKKDDKDKKDEKRSSKKLDTKTKSSQRLSKTINKEKEKKDKNKDKKEGKIEKNKEEKKVGEKKKDKKEENKEEKIKDKKEKTKKNETTKQEKKPEEKKIEEKKKEEKTEKKVEEKKTEEKKVEEKKPEEKKVEEKKPEEDKKVEEKKPEEDKKFEVKDEVKKVEEKKPEEKKDEVKKVEEKKLEEEKKIEDKKVEGKKDEEKKEETKELTKELINEIRTENIENKETKKEIDNKIELSSPPKTEEKKIIPKFIFQRLMNFYDKIHKFLNEEEIKNLLLISKDSTISSLPILKEINSSKIQKNEKALNDFKSTHKEEEYLSTIPSFQLSKVVIKALEKLNEEQNQKLFTSEQTPNKDIIYLYKVFLQLINKYSELKNKNIQDFWKSAKDIIYTSRKGQFGDHIKEMVNQIDFSAENLKVVNDMFKMNKEKFVPKYYNNLCQTTGLFFFLIKEILEYCGIMVGKKTCIPLEYKLLDYELKLNQKNEEKLNKMIEMAHKKKSLFNINES